MISVAFDARPLEPATRHWGVGAFVENVLCRLPPQLRCLGIADRFAPPTGVPIRAWPPVRHTQRAFFEVSPWLADHDVYWGTNHFLPQCLRRPAVVTVHDLLLLNGMDGEDRFGRWRLRSALRRATLIVANSATTADDLRAAFPGSARRIEVVRHGLTRLESTAPPDPGPAPQRPLALMLGCHRPRKNPEFALHAVARARDAGLDLELWVTGDIHPSFAPLFAAAPPWVRRLGVQPRQQLERLLAGAVALLFPSRYEGFGLPLLEAMAAACPVLALNTPINREMCGGAALLSDDVGAWASTLRELAAGGNLRAEMQERGRANAARFSWDQTAASYAEIFMRLAGRK